MLFMYICSRVDGVSSIHLCVCVCQSIIWPAGLRISGITWWCRSSSSCLGLVKEVLCLAGLGVRAVSLRTRGDVDSQNLLHLQWKLLGKAEEEPMLQPLEGFIHRACPHSVCTSLVFYKWFTFLYIQVNRSQTWFNCLCQTLVTPPCTESAAGKWPPLLVEHSAGPVSWSAH